MKLDTRNERSVSLQVSNLYTLPAGDYRISENEGPFLVKNITDQNITVQIELMDSKEKYITTVLYPGWNPELVVGIKGIPENSLQAGN